VNLPSYHDHVTMQLIGLLYMRPELMTTAIGILNRDGLIPGVAGQIYRAMRDSYQGDSFDFAQIQAQMSACDGWDFMMSAQQLIINPLAVTEDQVAEWCEALAERGYKSVCRQILMDGSESLSGEEVPLDEAVSIILQSLANFRQEGNFHWRSAAEIGITTRQMVASWSDPTQPLPGVRTGFPSLDRILHCLPNGEVCVVGARSQMGKTALVMQILFNVARFYVSQGVKKCVAIFSAETSAELLQIRMACAYAGVDQRAIKRGDATPEEVVRFHAALDLLDTLPIYVDESPNPTTDNMLVRALSLTNVTVNGERRRVGLMAFDFMELAGDEHKDEQMRVSRIMQGLKTLGKTIGCPIIALSQLSREAAAQGKRNKPPTVTDLRWSDMIGNLAYQILLLHRPAVYNAQKSLNYNPQNDPERELAIIVVAKNKDAPVGPVRLGFTARFARFYDPIDPYSSPDSPYYMQQAQEGIYYMGGYGGLLAQPASQSPSTPNGGSYDEEQELQELIDLYEGDEGEDETLDPMAGVEF
jgi:replicative DNA helicase